MEGWRELLFAIGGGATVQFVGWILGRSDQAGDRREKQLAASIRSSEMVNEAVRDVAVAGAEDSGKFVMAETQKLVIEQLQREVKNVSTIVRSSDKKLNALITAARIKVRAVDLGAFEDDEEDSEL